MNDRFDLCRRFLPIPKELQLTAIRKRWDLVPPSRWTRTDNPVKKPHRTELTDPHLMGPARGAEVLESTPWLPKFEDQDRWTEEEEKFVESARLSIRG